MRMKENCNTSTQTKTRVTNAEVKIKKYMSKAEDVGKHVEKTKESHSDEDR